MRTSVFATLVGVALAAPLPSLADAALILVQSDYERLDDVAGANQASALAQLAGEHGFDVTASLDRSAPDAAQALEAFREAAEGGERVLVLVSGHVVSDGEATWLLTAEADEPTRFSIGTMAVPLDPLMDIAAEYPGQAVVLLAPSGEDMDSDVIRPVETLDAAQGVTVFTGRLDGLIRVAREGLFEPGLSYDDVLAEAPRGVEGMGYLSSATAFLPAEGGARVSQPRAATDPEDAFWVVAKRLNNAAGYQLYLDQFPNGAHAGEAKAALGQAAEEARNDEESAEEALGLNQSARRQVQRNLALLGFDPRGIDGIFGGGTRKAIAAYQKANGHAETGYLTRPVLVEMTAKADARAQQLEAEAIARQAAQEREDRAFWEQTGQGRDEAALRAYLDRYPDGLFSEVAEGRLDDIEAQKRARAAEAERAFWDQVRGEDLVSSYRAYLERYPDGLFKDEAEARIADLKAPDALRDERARAEEREIAGTRVVRLMIERKLFNLGFEVGDLDGKFTPQTRKGIRRFQRAYGLEVTGFVDRATLARLL